MKNTALINKHIALGAKIVPFAGYYMPLQYTGVNDEHLTVREKAGVFDVSHMGEFILKGEGALELIQMLCTNDASKLTEGKVQYSCMTNETGGIVDDLLVYKLAEKAYMLVVNASNLEKDWKWIQQHNKAAVETYNISDKTTLLAVQGPNATDILRGLTDLDLQNMGYYSFAKGKFAGVENVLISATGYTGAGGFEIYFENQYAEKMWDAIFKAGEEFGIKPCGLAARDTLRLEMGFCLYGNDIDETTSPLEAGLGWITKFSKPFINSESLLQQKEEGIKRKLVGFKMVEKGISRQGYEIKDKTGALIGTVTSGTMAPSLKTAIGLGYVKKEWAVPGNEVYINVRNKNLKAEVVKLPFYQPA